MRRIFSGQLRKIPCPSNILDGNIRHVNRPCSSVLQLHEPCEDVRTVAGSLARGSSSTRLAISLALLVFGTLPRHVQGLSVDTPQHVIQCASTLIQWSGGTGPYQLDISPPDSDPDNVLSFTSTGLTFSWNTDKPAGSNLTIYLTDADGTLAQSDPFIVGPSQDSSCLGGQDGASSSSTPPPTTSPPTTSPPTASPSTTQITTSTTSLLSVAAAPTPTPPSSSRTRIVSTPPTSTSTHSSSVISTGSSEVSATATSGPGQTNSNVSETLSISVSSGSYNTSSPPQGFTSSPTFDSITATARAQSATSSTSTGLPGQAQRVAQRRPLDTGAIAGITVGGFVTVVALGCLLVWRRRQMTAVAAASKSSGEVPVFPPQPPAPPTKCAQLQSELSASAESSPQPAQTHFPQQSHGGLSQGVTDPLPVETRQSIVSNGRYSALAALAGRVPRASIASRRRSANSAHSARTPQSRQATREPRYETDGGVRLAGGPLGAALDDDVLSDVHSTFPPPYGTY